MLKADDSMFNITQPGEETQSERSDTNCGESLRSEKLDDGQSEPSEKADRSTEKDDGGSTAEPNEPVENEQRNENIQKNVNGVSTRIISRFIVLNRQFFFRAVSLQGGI